MNPNDASAAARLEKRREQIVASISRARCSQLFAPNAVKRRKSPSNPVKEGRFIVANALVKIVPTGNNRVAREGKINRLVIEHQPVYFSCR